MGNQLSKNKKDDKKGTLCIPTNKLHTDIDPRKRNPASNTQISVSVTEEPMEMDDGDSNFRQLQVKSRPLENAAGFSQALLNSLNKGPSNQAVAVPSQCKVNQNGIQGQQLLTNANQDDFNQFITKLYPTMSLPAQKNSFHFKSTKKLVYSYRHQVCKIQHEVSVNASNTHASKQTPMEQKRTSASFKETADCHHDGTINSLGPKLVEDSLYLAAFNLWVVEDPNRTAEFNIWAENNSDKIMLFQLWLLANPEQIEACKNWAMYVQRSQKLVNDPLYLAVFNHWAAADLNRTAEFNNWAKNNPDKIMLFQKWLTNNPELSAACHQWASYLQRQIHMFQKWAAENAAIGQKL